MAAMDLNVAIGAALALLGVAGFCLWLPFARHRLHRLQEIHHPASPTMELREEPPAVVNLLVQELELGPDALAATLLDLAARRYLEIVELSEEENIVLVKRHDRDELLPYEALVLDVVERATAGQPHATVKAIGQALGPGSATEWMMYKQEVQMDARRRGLVSTKPATYGVNALLFLSLLPTAGVVVAAPLAWIVTPFLFVGLLLTGLILLVRGRHDVLTDKGRDAGAHWLGVRHFVADYGSFADLPPAAVAVWDRYLAYGAAMGLSDNAVHGLVTELRTTLSMHDVRQAASAIHLAMRMAKDPQAQLQWLQQVTTQRFGANADPSQLYGPEAGDFWELLGNAGRGWPIAAMAGRTNPDLFRRASNARLDSLVAAAPPEVAADVSVLVGRARSYVEAMAASESANQGGPQFPSSFDAEVRGAFDRLIAATAAHLDVQPTAMAVMESLLGQTMSFAPPPTQGSDLTLTDEER